MDCKICDKKFKEKRYLTVHIRQVHKITADSTETKYNISCPSCNLSVTSHKLLVEHVQSKHEVSIETENVNFKNQEEFLSWKASLEKDKCSFFRLVRSYKVNNIKHTFYKCHRSEGPKKSHSLKPRTITSKKSEKSQGSCKIKGQCTAALYCKYVKDGINVNFIKTHFGHDIELQHMPLPKIDKDALSTKLSEGIPMNTILNEVRNSVADSLERIHLVTKKDLHNLSKQNKISHPEKLYVSTEMVKNKMEYALSLLPESIDIELQSSLNQHLDKIILILSNDKKKLDKPEPVNKHKLQKIIQFKLQTRLYSTKRKQKQSSQISNSDPSVFFSD